MMRERERYIVFNPTLILLTKRMLMARLFVGLQIPTALKTHPKRLQRAVPPGARVSRPINWHLTLAFIGEADLSQAKAALAARSEEHTSELQSRDQPVC